MSVRVHELAKRCGLSNKAMIEKLQAIHYPVKSHSSTVDNITAEAIAKEHGYVPPVEAPPPPPPTPEPAAAPAPKPVAAPVAATATLETPAPPVAPKPIAPPPAPKAAPPAPVVPPPPPAKPAAPVTPPPVAAPAPRSVPPVPVRPPVVPARKPVVVPPRSVPQRPVAPVTAEPLFVVDEAGNKVIHMKPPVVVRDLAYRLGIKPHLLLMELMEMNVFANLNEGVEEDVGKTICERHGYQFELEKRDRGGGTVHAPPKKIEVLDEGEKTEDLRLRPPVVTFMGHVDHGKTSLLDAIRKTDVATHESGGITQHIGASMVTLPDGKQISFLDTPGHEAFTKMRARGATVTDLVVLVVAADDGIMPQTIEALNHAKAAKVPILVAINKCDLPAANPDRVRKQLQEHGLTPETWGGETITVEVSATTKKGITDLLEMIILQAEIMELKASPISAAKGHVIEAQLEPGMGPTATVLVSKGLLKVGDAIICGPHWAKIRALIDDKGKRTKEASASMPVKIVGLSGVPEAGAEFHVMHDEKEARTLSEQRQMEARATAGAEGGAPRVRLEDLMAGAKVGEKKILSLVVKADVQGSLEAIQESLTKLSNDKADVNFIHGAVGNITENDVLLASASRAIVVGFRVKLESGSSEVAKREGVQIKLYTIIYELIDQIEEAIEGLFEPEAKETILGHATVRTIFELSKGPKVAGCAVTDGKITRAGRVRLLRKKAVQYEGRIISLRHFQDDAREVKAGQECGLRLDNFEGFQEGDVLESYQVEKAAKTAA